MAEELKQQFAEQMPGGIQIFSRALGMTTKELFAAMENGELLAAEVLPSVAKELSKTARNNDALTKSLKTSRSQWGIFMNNLKLMFDGFGSDRLDKGVGSFVQALTKLAKTLKPLAQILFYVVGLVVDLVAIIAKSALSAFKGFLNIFKAISPSLQRFAEGLASADNKLMRFLQGIGNVGVYFAPFFGFFAILGDVLEEFVNIFTGHAEGILAGSGETLGERFSNGLIGKGLGNLLDYIKSLLPEIKSYFVDLGKSAGQALVEGLKDGILGMGSGIKDLLPDWMVGSSGKTTAPPESFFNNNASQGLIQIYLDGEKKMEQVFDSRLNQTLEGSM